MAQLSLRERLQPALLDRLIDNERLLTCYEFAFPHDELRRLGISERELVGILTAQGLRVVDQDNPTSGRADADATIFSLRLFASGGSISLSHLKALVLKP